MRVGLILIRTLGVLPELMSLPQEIESLHASGKKIWPSDHGLQLIEP